MTGAARRRALLSAIACSGSLAGLHGLAGDLGRVVLVALEEAVLVRLEPAVRERIDGAQLGRLSLAGAEVTLALVPIAVALEVAGLVELPRCGPGELRALVVEGGGAEAGVVAIAAPGVLA